MHIDIPLNHQLAATPQITVNESNATRVQSKSMSAQHSTAASSSKVTISDEALKLSEASGSSEVQKADELRDETSKIDFHNTSQVELGNLVSKLIQNHELTPDQAAPFISAATDTVPPRGPNEKFDLAAHFDKVKSILDNGARTNPNLRWGASYAASEINVLNNIQSFANSSRLHIMSPT